MRGTRLLPWAAMGQPADLEGPPGYQWELNLTTIACKPEYRAKSVEELRWEDYQVCSSRPACLEDRLWVIAG